MEENKNEKPAQEKVEQKKPEETKTNAGEKKETPKKEETKKDAPKVEAKPNEKKVEPKESKKPMDPEKKKKIIKISVIAVIIIAIIAAVIIYFTVFHKKTINLADYIDVKFYTETSDSYYYDDTENEAYDGYSTAEVTLDSEKLKDLLGSRRAAERFIEKTTLTIQNENNGNLSNGDNLEIKVEISSNYLDDEKLKLKEDVISVPVEGLEEANVLDLFGEDDFEVEVTGISPNLSVSVNNNSTNEFIKDNVSYSVSEYSGIANGDTITITAYYDATTALEEGIIIAQDTYEYTVEGMPEYVDSVEDLSSTALESIRAKFVEYVNDAISDEGIDVISYNYDGVSYSDQYTASTPELVATYLLTKKGTSSYWNDDNKLCAIYKVVYTITSTGSTYEWYFVVDTYDVAIKDGELYNGEDLYYDVSSAWDEGKTQEEAYDDLIDSYKGSYVIETVE